MGKFIFGFILGAVVLYGALYVSQFGSLKGIMDGSHSMETIKVVPEISGK